MATAELLKSCTSVFFPTAFISISRKRLGPFRWIDFSLLSSTTLLKHNCFPYSVTGLGVLGEPNAAVYCSNPRRVPSS